MNSIVKKAAPFLVLLVVMAGYLYLFSSQRVLGSVVTGSEYMYATSTTAAAATPALLKTTYQTSPVCVLGSVVIASSSAAQFTIWNATSTTDIASSTLAVFEANAAEGTYTFDVSCTRGIVIRPDTSFNGYVITTYR